MAASSAKNLELPEWYTIERNAEKSINRLYTVRELDYYLKHPDDSIRRLAILRLAALALKDSILSLKEIMEDASETEANKELAAWAIKSVARRLDSDLFLSNRLLSGFTGNETLAELFPVSIISEFPAPSFNFSKMPEDCRIRLQSPNLRIQRDEHPEIRLDYARWITSVVKRISEGLVPAMRTSLTATGRLLKKAVLSIPEYLKNRPEKPPKSKPVKPSKPVIPDRNLIGANELADCQTLPDSVGSSTPHLARLLERSSSGTSQSSDLLEGRRTGIPPSFPLTGQRNSSPPKPSNLLDRSSSHVRYYPTRSAPDLRQAAFGLLRILLLPIRLPIRFILFLSRHKPAVIASIVFLYLLLTYTSFGRVATLRYLGIDLQVVQTEALDNIQQTAGLVRSEFSGISGTVTAKPKEEQILAADTAPVSGTTGKTFQVSTKKGLNIRVSPGSTAAKAGNLLAYGTELTDLDQRKKDSEGRIWYYVQSPEGTVGWVYSGGLQEKEANTSNE